MQQYTNTPHTLGASGSGWWDPPWIELQPQKIRHIYIMCVLSISYLSLYIYPYLSISIHIYPISIHIYPYAFIHMFIHIYHYYLSIYIYICMYIYLFVYLCIHICISTYHNISHIYPWQPHFLQPNLGPQTFQAKAEANCRRGTMSILWMFQGPKDPVGRLFHDYSDSFQWPWRKK